jgi:hypothetical protein
MFSMLGGGTQSHTSLAMDIAPQIVAAFGIGLMLPFIALPIARMLGL